MAEEKPIVYILRGDDSTKTGALINQFKAELGDAEMAGLNTNSLDGAQASLEDIRSAALSMPFLTERRLVILQNALARYEGKKNEERKKFLELLDSLPQTTALVLVVEDKLVTKRDGSYWEKLSARHWLIKWAKGAGGRAWIKDCALPTSREMTGWVQRKVKELGGEFRADAAARLAEYVGTNTQRAVQEITKLLTYVNYAKPVTADDVALLTAQDQEGNIFDLVDAIGERNGCKALEALQILLETNDAMDLFGMIARQFRLLLEAREIIDEGGDAGQVRNDLNLHPYVARKISTQASRFTMPKLEEIYRRLLKIDLDMKTGGMPGDVAFEVLIAELTL